MKKRAQTARPPRRAAPAGQAHQANQIDLHLRHRGGKKHAALLRREAARYLSALKLSGVELSLAVVGDAEIHALNKAWRGKDKPTDVLSFPAGEAPPGAPGPRPLGDVIISLDTTRRAAREYGRTVEDELRRYLAHGLLHLLGHDHHRRDEARRMAAWERRLLGEQGMLPT